MVINEKLGKKKLDRNTNAIDKEVDFICFEAEMSH